MKKIFYIEREKFLCLLLEKSLPEQEFKVFTTTDPNDLCQIKDFSPDLVLVDTSLINQLSLENLPFVAVGFENRGSFKYFLRKPLSPSTVRERILELLELVCLEKEA